MERSGFTLVGFDSPMVDWRSTMVIYVSTVGDSKLTSVPQDFILVGFDFSLVDSNFSVVNFHFT